MLDQNGREQQELGQLIDVERLALLGQHRHEGVDHRQEGDVEDVDLVRGHQVQQQVDRTLEDRGGHRVGHPPTLPNGARPAAHPWPEPRRMPWPAPGAVRTAPYHGAP